MSEPEAAHAGSRWRMRVSYDGRTFLGWQRQDQGLTVQEALETALAVVLREPVT